MEGQEVDWKRLVQFVLLGSSDLEQYAILLVRPARMDALKYAGPQENGHMYPDPTLPATRACRMVAMPEATIEARIMACACAAVPPMAVTRTTAKIQPTEMTNTCWRPSTIVLPRGGISSTE